MSILNVKKKNTVKCKKTGGASKKWWSGISIADRLFLLVKKAMRKASRVGRTQVQVNSDRLEAASSSSKVEADALGYKYPMPWTTEEALANKDNLQGRTGHKHVLLSRIACVADAIRRRYRNVKSQRDEVKLKCAFPGCPFLAIISFRLHGECISDYFPLRKKFLPFFVVT